MASPVHHAYENDPSIPEDPVESVVSAIPFVLPAVGAVLMFLLAFIAVYMA